MGTEKGSGIANEAQAWSEEDMDLPFSWGWGGRCRSRPGASEKRTRVPGVRTLEICV